MLKLYQSLVRPNLEYCVQAYGDLTCERI